MICDDECGQRSEDEAQANARRERASAMEAFNISGFQGIVALVGAGGKTGLMFRLAREIAARGDFAITTTTTHIRPPSRNQSPYLILTCKDPELACLPSRLNMYGHVTIGHAQTGAGKVSGINESALLRCRDSAHITLVEADGAAGRPIKAPESWEPAIPSFADMVIPVAGLDCLGRPASSEWVFRLNRLLEISGIRGEEPLTPRVVAKVILSPRGGMKGVPKGASVVPYLNKSDLCPPRVVENVAEEILRRGCPRIRRVVAGSLLFGFYGQSYE